MLHTFRQL